jgi:hypothetical protein
MRVHDSMRVGSRATLVSCFQCFPNTILIVLKSRLYLNLNIFSWMLLNDVRYKAVTMRDFQFSSSLVAV